MIVALRGCGHCCTGSITIGHGFLIPFCTVLSPICYWNRVDCLHRAHCHGMAWFEFNSIPGLYAQFGNYLIFRHLKLGILNPFYAAIRLCPLCAVPDRIIHKLQNWVLSTVTMLLFCTIFCHTILLWREIQFNLGKGSFRSSSSLPTQHRGTSLSG